jgi:formylglycine-generating enzyme required for sulfatase activity
MGPEKQWENPNDVDESSSRCVPEIENVVCVNEISVNKKANIAVQALCDDTVIQKYVWSFDSGLTWDTTGDSVNSYAWSTGDTGIRKIQVFVINATGIVSKHHETTIEVIAGYPYIVNEIPDTIVSRNTRINRALLADDSDGTIRMYYWGMTDSGWNDSAGSSTYAIVEIYKPDGGPKRVRWGAYDDDGLFVLDTFVIFFNRGPDSIALLKPSLDAEAVFDRYNIVENRGEITCSFVATDPDSMEELAYSFIVKNTDGDTLLSYFGSNTTTKILNVKASSMLLWSLQAKDAFGDSIQTEGTFSTPRPPSTIEGMVLVPGGVGNAYRMGQTGFDLSEQPIHTVMFKYGFLMDSTEVTRKSFGNLMQQNDTILENSLPVSGITWFDAVMYCNAKSKKYGLDTIYRYNSSEMQNGNFTRLYGLTIDSAIGGFRLPTEAEWEYACKLDFLTLYYWGNDVSFAASYCWTSDNSSDKPHFVALKKPTQLHLYDMAGNVWEWCNDWFDPSYYSVSPLVDPTGPDGGTEKVIRGGSFKHSLYFAQSGTRSKLDPAIGNPAVGFRTVLTVK